MFTMTGHYKFSLVVALCLFQIPMFSLITLGDAVPEYYIAECTSSNENMQVCINCKNTGQCTGSYSYTYLGSPCDPGKYCLDGYCSEDSPPLGCECTENEPATCKLDPYQSVPSLSKAYIDCTLPQNPAYVLCSDLSTSAADPSNCGCLGPSTYVKCLDTCPDYYLGNNNDGCEHFYYCIRDEDEIQLFPNSCNEGLCFDEVTCTCSEQISCPACGKIPDEENSPTGYLECVYGADPILITGIGHCDAPEVFKPSPDYDCECVIECPVGCDKIDIPVPVGVNNDYYVCNSTTHVHDGGPAQVCPEGEFFYQNICGCMPCLSCGFADDPVAQNCADFLSCAGEVKNVTCTGDDICFYDNTCECL